MIAFIDIYIYCIRQKAIKLVTLSRGYNKGQAIPSPTIDAVDVTNKKYMGRDQTKD